MTSCGFFKLAANTLHIYFRLPIWWRLTFKTVKNYLHTKLFQPDISIHGWDITTSGFWKQTAAILKCYFQFRFWPFRRYRNVILQRMSGLLIFCELDNRRQSYDVISVFQDGGYTVANLLTVSGLMMFHVSEGQNFSEGPQSVIRKAIFFLFWIKLNFNQINSATKSINIGAKRIAEHASRGLCHSWATCYILAF